MKHVNTYVCLVDNHRRPAKQRNTRGRYYVGAKSAKEAKRLLQNAIGFGSVQVYYIAAPDGIDPVMGYKEVKKGVWNGDGFTAENVRHATAPVKEGGLD